MRMPFWIERRPALSRWHVIAVLVIASLLAACAGDSNTPTPTVTPTTGVPVAVIAVERAMVFPAPDRDAEPFTSLYERERVAVEGESSDGSFLRVTVEGQTGWILRAQVEIEGDLALVADAATAEVTAEVAVVSTATLTEAPTLAAPTAILTDAATEIPITFAATADLETAEVDSIVTVGGATPVPTLAGPTRTPLPTRTPGGQGTPTELPVKPGTPPPLDITLPDGWQAADMLVPFSSYGEARDLPLTIYAGPLDDDVRGIIYLFWDFPNVVSPSGELNLWADGVQLLRGSLIGDACNLGVYEQQSFTVGGQSGVGAFYQADECQEQANTAGWFATLKVGGTSFAFFVAVEPLEAMPDQVAALQAILDSVEFDDLP